MVHHEKQSESCGASQSRFCTRLRILKRFFWFFTRSLCVGHDTKSNSEHTKRSTMPQGYKKHTKGISRKVARGGGSHKGSKSNHSNQGRAGKHRRKEFAVFDDGFDCSSCEDAVYPMTSKQQVSIPLHYETTSSKIRKNSLKREEGDCSICFESRPLVPLMKACSWHDAACEECLRQVYVTRAQTSVRNFPVKCFHPQCRTRIRLEQLQKHGLIRSEEEAQTYHRMTELAKGKAKGAACVACPYCDYPRAFREGSNDEKQNANNRVFNCRQYHKNFIVSPFREIIQAIENYGDGYEGWCFCPGCKMLVTKEYGDDEVECGNCQTIFSFHYAQRESGFKYPLARPTDLDITDVLYLYW